MLYLRIVGRLLSSALTGALVVGVTLAMWCAVLGVLTGEFYGMFVDRDYPWYYSLWPDAVGYSVYAGLFGVAAGAFQGSIWGLVLRNDQAFARRLGAVAQGSADGSLGGALLGITGGMGAALFSYYYLPTGQPGENWLKAGSNLYSFSVCGGLFCGAAAGAWAFYSGISKEALRARISFLGPLATPLAYCFAPPVILDGAVALAQAAVKRSPRVLRFPVRALIPMRYVPPVGFFRTLMFLTAIQLLGLQFYWGGFRIPLGCACLGWICGWVRRPQIVAAEQALKAANPRDRPNLLLNLLCFLVPPLGLLSWLALDHIRPRLARSAGRSAVRSSVLIYAAYQLLIMPFLVQIAIDAIGVARLQPIDPVKMEKRIYVKRMRWYKQHGIEQAPPRDNFTTERQKSMLEIAVEHATSEKGKQELMARLRPW